MEKLTLPQRVAVKNDPDHCPICGTDMLRSGQFFSKGKEGWRTVTCASSKCGASWVEQYNLSTITNV